MKESLLERKVVAHCRKLGILCYKFSSPARRGVPDRILLYRGRVMFLELKAPGKNIVALQERELQILRAQGFHAEWTDNFNEAQQLITTCLGLSQITPTGTG